MKPFFPSIIYKASDNGSCIPCFKLSIERPLVVHLHYLHLQIPVFIAFLQ